MAVLPVKSDAGHKSVREGYPYRSDNTTAAVIIAATSLLEVVGKYFTAPAVTATTSIMIHSEAFKPAGRVASCTGQLNASGSTAATLCCVAAAAAAAAIEAVER